MKNFCVRCGSPLDDNTGLCPNCNKQTTSPQPTTNSSISKPVNNKTFSSKEEKKQAWAAAKRHYKDDVALKKAKRKNDKKTKKEVKRSKMSKGQKVARVLVKLLLILLIVALAIFLIFSGLKSLGIISGNSSDIEDETTTTQPNTTINTDLNGSIGKDNPPTGDMPADFEVTSPNADEYYHNNSNVISVIDATDGGTTEAEAYANLTSRGFTMYPITTEYTMDGTYGDAIEISGNGTDKHPTYSTIYVTDSGFVWSIFEINGKVYAKPVTYHLDYNPETQIIFSESASITSYDSTENKFYITQPHETSLDVRVVGRIDAETLNTFTAREIEMS